MVEAEPPIDGSRYSALTEQAFEALSPSMRLRMASLHASRQNAVSDHEDAVSDDHDGYLGDDEDYIPEEVEDEDGPPPGLDDTVIVDIMGSDADPE